jgi:hypothetical protein
MTDNGEPLGMRGTQSHQTAVIPEPVLHAYTKERGTYEESTFWNPSWTLAKGSVMITDIYDLATSARAIGKGELVSEKSHKEQVAPSLVGLGGPTKKCPENVCLKQTSSFHYGICTFIVGGCCRIHRSTAGAPCKHTYPRRTWRSPPRRRWRRRPRWGSTVARWPSKRSPPCLHRATRPSLDRNNLMHPSAWWYSPKFVAASFEKSQK